MRFSALILSSLLTVTAWTAQADVTAASCNEDYAAMIEAAETNRAKALADLEYQLRRTANDEQSARLEAEMEAMWDVEEELRNNAAVAHKDCLAYVKSLGS